MVAEQAIDQDDVPFPREMRAEIDAFSDDANSGRREEQLVASASVDDLGVAGDDLDARLGRSSRHRAGDLPHEVDGHAFFHDRRTGKIERPRPADRQIVDRAAHGELADVAAGEDQRVDHEGISGESEPVAVPREIAEIETRLILERRQRCIVEGPDEHIVDQILHRLAAAAMGECHRRHVDLPQNSRADARSNVHSAAS